MKCTHTNTHTSLSANLSSLTKSPLCHPSQPWVCSHTVGRWRVWKADVANGSVCDVVYDMALQYLTCPSTFCSTLLGHGRRVFPHLCRATHTWIYLFSVGAHSGTVIYIALCPSCIIGRHADLSVRPLLSFININIISNSLSHHPQMKISSHILIFHLMLISTTCIGGELILTFTGASFVMPC